MSKEEREAIQYIFSYALPGPGGHFFCMVMCTDKTEDTSTIHMNK